MASYLLQEGQKNVEPLIQQAFKWVFDTTGRQITYTREYEDSVGQLKQLHPNWVAAEVDKAIRKGKYVANDDSDELKAREREIMAQAENAVNEFERLDAVKGFTCCWRVPNVWRQYRVGRKARKCLQKIEDFRTQEYSKVIGVEIPPGEVTNDFWINSVKPKAYELQSRVDVMNKIIHVLEDESSELVGLWGPEGAGKSTLINQVLYRVNEQKHLQQIHIQVPKKKEGIDLQKEIQAKIFEKICPTLLESLEKFEKRAEKIRTWFNSNKEMKAVLILDGLWQKIDLVGIGIPDNEEKVCDVILTARDMDLLVNDMGLSRERTFEVGPLSPEESVKLFLHVVGRSEQTINEEKISVAGELVKYCGGLPKLIEQQACILTNQRDIYAWHDALREAKFQNIEKMLEPVEEALSTWSSNENDRKEIRSLFSLCGLFGESSILVRDLIIQCRALDIFTRDVTVKETKDRAKRLLHILRARSLVGGDSHKVEITDFFQEVAILIASKENFLSIRNDSGYKRGGFMIGTEKQLQVCTALSIDGLDILEDYPELEYLCLKMLQLGSKDHSLKIDDAKFFNHMKELRGLHLKHIDFKPSSFPSTIKNLQNLQTLCMDDCRLKDMGLIGELKKLQILKISGSDIIELPTDVGNLTDLRLLDLRGCKKLQVIEHGVLQKLKRLEELYLDDCFDKWKVPHYKSRQSRSNASLDELKEMTCLSVLHVYVPSSTMLPENLKIQKLEKYKILMGDVKNYSKENAKARTLRLDLSSSSSILWEEGVKRILHSTQSLYLKNMIRMPNPSIHQLSFQGFPYLNDLHLQDCDSVEFIVESSQLVLAFPNLETLTLVDLKNLRKICNGQVANESFRRLNAVTVEKCPALKNLFDFSLTERISALKKIEVKDCANIKEIVTDDTGRNGGMWKKIQWDELRLLSLENLEQIVSFCNTQTCSEGVGPRSTSETTAFFDGDLISFPGLQKLSLTGLCKARKILYQNIQPAELSNLQSLTVEGFEDASQLNDMLFYFPKTPQQDLATQKQTLGSNCPKDQVDHDSRTRSPPDLSTSGMKNEKDKTLCAKGHLQGKSRHENLHCLTICGCRTLKFLFTTSMVQALPHLTELTIAECRMMEGVIKVDNGDNGLESIGFQELTTLCLQSLENLTTFSQENISISFPSLKSLNISGCNKLTALFTDSEDGETEEEIPLFHAKVSPSFPSLDNLDICRMNNLTKIWQCQVYKHAISSKHGGEPSGSSPEGSASKLLEAFLKIKKLHITTCGSLVKVLDVKGSSDVENNDNCLEDAQLNEVKLKNLMNIEHIWGTNCPNGRRICYRYLEAVSLRGCQRIESLFPASMANDLLRLQSLKVKSCDGMKHLIAKGKFSK